MVEGMKSRERHMYGDCGEHDTGRREFDERDILFFIVTPCTRRHPLATMRNLGPGE